MNLPMRTLDLASGAKLLNMHRQTLRLRAKAGKIPGASKPGKKWVFLEAGLLAYLNSLSPCPFTGEEKLGGSNSTQAGGDLESLLGLPTRRRRRNFTKG